MNWTASFVRQWTGLSVNRYPSTSNHKYCDVSQSLQREPDSRCYSKQLQVSLCDKIWNRTRCPAKYTSRTCTSFKTLHPWRILCEILAGCAGKWNTVIFRKALLSLYYTTLKEKEYQVTYFFIFHPENLYRGYSFEVPWWGTSTEYSQRVFIEK